MLNALVIWVGLCGASQEAVTPPPAEFLEKSVADWISSQEQQLAEEASRLWAASMPADAPRASFDAILEIAFLLSSDVRDLVSAADRDDWGTVESSMSGLDLPPVGLSNVRLLLGRILVALGATTEAEQVLSGVDEDFCADPATLAFLKAVCSHARLDKDAGLPVIERLLDPASRVPERYRALARLMKQDLQDLEDNELGQTARQMRELQKKLQRGKSGKKTQQEEKQILQRLDKMIEKLEQQQQQMQGQGGTQGGSLIPTAPAEEGGVQGQTAPGEVDKKPVGKSAGWGDLPEKARTDARNLINRKFPSHYRRAVEEYLKKLAERPTK